MFVGQEREPEGDAIWAVRAVEVDPGHIEARLALASRAESLEDRLHHLQVAVDAGDRLWVAFSQKHPIPDWWELVGPRPYLKAIHALGKTHADLGNVDAARWCYERLMRMNPHDDQDVAASLERLDEASAPRMR